MKTRIAVIGAGAHARDQHFPVLRSFAEVDLVAACDVVRHKAEEVCGLYGISAAYTDYREMLERERPDAVVIVLRPMDLTAVALGCLDRGCHLMVEKPPGCSTAEARRILERARANGRKVMVAMNRRFMPVARALRDAARERGLVYCAATYNKDGVENYLETRHFLRALAGEEEGESELADVIESVRLCEAIATGHDGPLGA